MTDRKIRIAITHGDTNGIGYEVIFKAFDTPEMLELCTPIIYGSPKVAAYYRKTLNLPTTFTIINNAGEARDGALNLLTTFDDDVRIDIGQPSEEAGMAALRALDRAMADYPLGLYDALVTAPINKHNMQSAGFQFPGHTEYIEARLGNGSPSLMVMAGQGLRVALVTNHLPISQVSAAVTTEAIVKKATILHASLRRDFRITNPRIAVLALNPHAGDLGAIGTDEQQVIQPALEQLEANGIQAFGPYPADGFFGNHMGHRFDAVLAMYHDQGLTPFKALCADTGVNFTAGLPIVRTSPDHGTAYDIAGRGIADATSMRQAIYTAIDICRSRADYDQCHQSPLPKLYHERRDDSEKARFAVSKPKDAAKSASHAKQQ